MIAHAASITTIFAFERNILINFADPPPEVRNGSKRFAAGRGADDDGTNIAAQYARECIALKPASMERAGEWVGGDSAPAG